MYRREVVTSSLTFAFASLQVRQLGGSAVAEEEGSLRLQIATACIPHIYDSGQHISDVREEYRRGLEGLLEGTPWARSGGQRGGIFVNGVFLSGGGGGGGDKDYGDETGSIVVVDPLTSTGSGGLGYYIIYQGYNDRYLRQLLARVYWAASGELLSYTAPFLLTEPDPSTTAGEGTLLHFRSPFAELGYSNLCRVLLFRNSAEFSQRTMMILAYHRRQSEYHGVVAVAAAGAPAAAAGRVHVGVLLPPLRGAAHAGKSSS